MPSFRALLKQDGEGCDYTIGCAQKISDPFEADDLAAACERVRLNL